MFVIDFDDTLFDTHAYKRARYGLLEQCGVAQEVAESTYREIRMSDNAYTNEKHADALASLGHVYQDILVALQKADGEWLKQFVLPGAQDFLEQIRSFGKPVILVTLGDPDFQKKKVLASGLHTYFDQIEYCYHDKRMSLNKLVKDQEKVWFINDKVSETVDVKKEFLQLLPVLKVAPEVPIEEYQQSGLPFFTTFPDIISYVQTH